MCSTPPASATSAAPTPICAARLVTAVIAPAHMRSTAYPGTERGRPASTPTVRPSVRPWSPCWVVAAIATSSIRSGGSCGWRRSSSRTALTARSSARVPAYRPSARARPNGVRTPSTNTVRRTRERAGRDGAAGDGTDAVGIGPPGGTTVSMWMLRVTTGSRRGRHGSLLVAPGARQPCSRHPAVRQDLRPDRAKLLESNIRRRAVAVTPSGGPHRGQGVAPRTGPRPVRPSGARRTRPRAAA